MYSCLRNINRSDKFLSKTALTFALCLVTCLSCFARPREVVVTDEYDGMTYSYAEKVAKALARNKTSNLFRIIVIDRGPSGSGYTTALYNRKQKTLKIYNFSNWLIPDDETGKGPQLARRSQATTEWLYHKVNDAKLRRFAAIRNENYLFGIDDDHKLAKYGIQARRLSQRVTYWDVQPNGKETRARWIYDEKTLTYRYPKK